MLCHVTVASLVARNLTEAHMWAYYVYIMYEWHLVVKFCYLFEILLDCGEDTMCVSGGEGAA